MEAIMFTSQILGLDMLTSTLVVLVITFVLRPMLDFLNQVPLLLIIGLYVYKNSTTVFQAPKTNLFNLTSRAFQAVIGQT